MRTANYNSGRTMPLATRRRIGQLLIGSFPAHDLSVELRALAREFGLGGVILFSRNIESPEQVSEVAAEAEQMGAGQPLWVSVDQEGGRVARLKAPFTVWPPMATLGRAGSEELASRFATALAAELSAVGVTLDYAPVLDGFGRRQAKEVIIGAIVNPSEDIAHGYEGWELVLRDGRRIDGIILADGDPTIIQSMGGLTQMVPASLIQQRRWFGRSLMMGAEQLGLTAQQVADIAAYLRE